MSLIIAMEGADEVGVEEQSEVEAARTETEVVAGQADVNETAADISGEVNDVQSGLQDADQLVDMGEAAQEAVDRGDGLSEDAAAQATIAVERIHHRLYGAVRKQKIVAAKESFGHASTRVASTKMIVEGITETLKDFWTAIKTFVKRLVDKIVLFINKIFGSKKVNEKHISNLKERIKNLDPKLEMKEKTLDNASLAKSISVNGKADMGTVKEIAHNLEKLAGISSNMIKASVDSTADMVKLVNSGANIAGIVGAIDAHTKTINGFVTGLTEVTAKFSPIKGSSKLTKTTDSATQVHAYGPFCDSVVLGVEVTVHNAPAFSTISFSFQSAKAKAIADKAAALSRGEIAELLNAAEKLNDVLTVIDKIKGDLKGLQTKIDDLAGDILKMLSSVADKGMDPAVSRSIKEIQRHVSDSLSVVNSFSMNAGHQLTRFVAVCMNYASASIANFGGSKK